MQWFDIEDLPNLGFDHDKIATAGIGRLLRRVLEDPLTVASFPTFAASAIGDLARGGAVARHFQRHATHHGGSDGASAKHRVQLASRAS